MYKALAPAMNACQALRKVVCFAISSRCDKQHLLSVCGASARKRGGKAAPTPGYTASARVAVSCLAFTVCLGPVQVQVMWFCDHALDMFAKKLCVTNWLIKLLPGALQELLARWR